jgi:hypothetical protein
LSKNSSKKFIKKFVKKIRKKIRKKKFVKNVTNTKEATVGYYGLALPQELAAAFLC